MDGVHIQLAGCDLWGAQVQLTLLAWSVDDTKTLSFRAWSGRVPAPRLTDELGNVYPAVPGDTSLIPPGFRATEWAFANGTVPKTVALGDGQITSEVGRADTLYFAAPVPAAKTLILELPCRNIGGTGVARFVIDLSAVRDHTGEWVRSEPERLSPRRP